MSTTDPTVPDLERDDDPNSPFATRLTRVASLLRRGLTRMDRIANSWSTTPPPEPDKPTIRTALAEIKTVAGQVSAKADDLLRILG